MNRGLWIARKNYLLCLIKKVSDGYGGDDPAWLKQHSSEVLEMCEGEKIEMAVDCYSQLVNELKYYS
mgnify:CR=1 FL=1